jgi:iron complex outermembrane receptor protein
MKNFTILLCAIFSLNIAVAQTSVSGTVKDANSEALPGANVVEKGTNNGTSTDFDGKFTLTVKDGAILVVSFAGYETKEVTVTGKMLNIVLTEGMQLDEVVVTGNRAKPRTVLDSPVPIDNISAAALKATGKMQVEQMLSYSVPSFNSATQAISDATAHFDPADLRGLGPSRTLVLMNGKRMKQSAQIYLNGTPGKGEVGIDLKSFPTAAVKRIEVLRDGASAQYGSDAIAGVINIILKDDTDFTEVNSHVGITSQSDGFNMGIDYNSTFNMGDAKVNLSLEYYDQNATNRAGLTQDGPGT